MESVTISKKCSKCRVIKFTGEFSKDSDAKDGLNCCCKKCASIATKKSAQKNKGRVHVAIPDFKICSKCSIKKSSLEFFKDGGKRDGLASHCKKCHVVVNKAHQKKNKSREIIVVPDFKLCQECNVERSSLDFYKVNRNKDGLSDHCRECTAIYKIKLRYNLLPGQFNAMLEAQGFGCAICRTDTPGGRGRWQVDHKHGTDIVRGLLHNGCNLGLGHFKDNVAVIGRAIDYLNGPTLGIQYKKNLSKAIKEKVLASQNYVCKICLISLSFTGKVCIDHDHLTNMVRGALCNGCNSGLGCFKDSTALLRRAIDYLNKYTEALLCAL